MSDRTRPDPILVVNFDHLGVQSGLTEAEADWFVENRPDARKAQEDPPFEHRYLVVDTSQGRELAGWSEVA